MKATLAVIAVALALFGWYVHTATQPTLEVITLQGEVNDDMAKAVKAQVEHINEDSGVKAVLLVVTSPGGGVLPTAGIYRALGTLKVPVVAYCEYLCASGGYYAVSAPTVKYLGIDSDVTVVGSIGVIRQVVRKPPCEHCLYEIYKSGALKQAGAPDHAPTTAEKANLQEDIDYLASVFYGAVNKARGAHIRAGDWPAIKTAKVFFGQQAISIGLVDKIMTREEAIEIAEKLAGVGHLVVHDPAA